MSNGAAEEMVAVGEELVSPVNSGAGAPFFGSAGDPLLDEFRLQEQLTFLNDGGVSASHQLLVFDGAECRSPGASDDGLFPYVLSWANRGAGHRRSASVSELCLGGADGLSWKPCLYYSWGYCKNGSACRSVHSDLPDDVAVLAGAKMDASVEQQCQDLLLRSKSQRLAAAFPYSPTGSLPGSPSTATKCLSLLLQQQQNESQRATAAAAAAALMLGGGGGKDAHKFMGRPRLDRADFASLMNPGWRQIYFTFSADSTF